MKDYNKTPEELKAFREKEMREFAEAEKNAIANKDTAPGTEMDSSSEVEPSQAPKFQQQHGNRKYTMFKNESSADNVARTRTDTHLP